MVASIAFDMQHAWYIPALPAMAFVAIALLNFFTPYGKHGDKIAVICMALSFILFFPVAHDLLKHHDLFTRPEELARLNTSGFDWMKFGGVPYLKDLGQDIYSLRVSFFVDPITLVMLAVVTFVALMVQVYSLGYMKGEVRYGWFFGVLSLFTAAMLTLVLADNFLLLYVCWEGVGICSYLLIGHYFERRSAAEAAKKAFITTRLGDVMLLIGIILLWRNTGTFDMREIFHHAEAGDISKWYLTMSTLFLFGGAVGKSAQFPLHVWLPDAMEGPTPVSALIHAATMVVAGVYLVARIMPLFEYSHHIALYVVITLGMITTLGAACIGIAQTDIKRVVAYSTLNSLGLMMVSLGFGPAGVAPAMLYLFTHAFFKALLFLGSGSVIHATEYQEVDHLGGLKEKMPITNATFFIGMLAMAGLIPLSGYWAKDEILVAARHYMQPGNIVILVLLLASLPLTAAYMARVYILTFQGHPRDHHAFEHAHESPPVMSWPLILLAIPAAIAGFVVIDGVGKAIGFGYGFLGFVSSTIEEPEKFKVDFLMAALSIGAVATGLLWARSFWARGLEADVALEARIPTLYRIFKNKFYVDEFYQWLINHVFLALARFIAFFDRTVVNDTGVNGAGQLGLGAGWFLKYFQTGKLPNYALFMAIGITLIALVGVFGEVMHPGHALIALIIIPILTAAGIVFVPSERKDWIRMLAVASSAVLFALSLYVFIDYKAAGPGGEQFRFQYSYNWIHNVGVLGDEGIRFHVGVDGIAAVMILLNGVVTLAGTLISWKIENKNKDFFVLFFLLTAGVFGTFSALDLFMFFFFYELAVLPMYLLIAYWGSSTRFPTFLRTKEYSAMKLMMMLVAASVLIFFGIFLTFREAGLGTFDLQALYGAHYGVHFQRWVFPMFAIGAGCLAGLWPFHTWSPDGHVAAPTAVSMLHAGVLMKLGAFGILRLGIQLFPEGAHFWMPGLVVLASVNVLYGAISAMGQTDFKYVIGYSSVSHMGLVLLGLATLDPVGINGAALQMFSHGVMTALMFSMVGAVYDQAHTRELAIFGGLASKMPRFTVFFIIAGLTSVGLPGFSGFVAEFNIFVGTFRTYPWAGGLAILAAGITAVYIFRLLALSFFGQFNEARWGGLKEMTKFEMAGGGLLIVFILFMGLWPDPFVHRISDTVVNHITNLPGLG